MRDMSEKLAGAVLIGAAVLAADNAPAALNLAGYNGCTIYLMIGIGGITFDDTNKIEFKLTHSDDLSSYSAVAQADIKGATVGTGGIVKSLILAHAAAAVYEIGYVGNKQGLKLLADFSGTHGTGTPIAALAVLGNPLTAPVS